MAVLSSCGSASTAVAPTITVSCVPTDVTVLGQSLCTATVTGESSTLVNWSVSGTGTGTINMTSGQYTAPATVPTNNIVTITATSQVASTLTATQSLTIEAATAISTVTCLNSNSNSTVSATTIDSGDALDCTAAASTGAAIPNVTWTVTNTNMLGGNVGTITAQGGHYVAPPVPPAGQSVTITASTANNLSTLGVPITVTFGSKVLSGTYVFSTSGRLTGGTNAFWARAGFFTVGGGTLTGTEDTNQGGVSNTVTTQNFSGSYSIGPDGRGTMQFCETLNTTNASCPLGSSAVTSFFRIVVVSPNQAELIEYSSGSSTAAGITAGGEMVSQDTSGQTTSTILSGVYSFNFAGVSSTGTEGFAAGDFSSNGHGTIAAGSTNGTLPGEIDMNVSGTLTGPVAIISTPYVIGSSGRGTATLNGLNFSFYPVSAGRSKFIEIDTGAASILVGDAYKQQTSLNCGWGLSALNGATVLETSGASPTGVIADLAAFTTSGTSGSFTGASLDENAAGAASSNVGTLTGSYAMDPCGRGTLSLGAHSYIFYVISPSFAVLQEITTGVTAHGFLLPSQGGPFTDSTFSGSYAFRFAGTDAAGLAANREDFLGQLTSAGSGTGLAGTLDLNDFGATQTGLLIANGTYSASGGLRAAVSLPVATAPATTRNLVLYMVSPTMFYLLDTDTTGTALGALNDQF